MPETTPTSPESGSPVDPADKRLFLADDDQWGEFNQALDRPAQVKPRLAELLEQSSLGTPEARALRATVSDEHAARIVQRAQEIEAEMAPCATCGGPVELADGQGICVSGSYLPHSPATRVTPPGQETHSLTGEIGRQSCTCGWEPGLGEVVYRAFDRHLLAVTPDTPPGGQSDG